MNPLLIVNPRSGGGRTGSMFDKMRGPIERALGPVDVALTERSRHAVEIAREAALAGRETVVAVGGDGSVHEVVSGLMEAREQRGDAPLTTRLGIIGQGTGGDFRKTLGIEHRLDRYCEVIAAGRSRPIDVGRFTYVSHDGRSERGFFVNILSIGMGGLVDQYVAEMGKHLGGTAAYFFASLRAVFKNEVGVVRCSMRTGGGELREQVLSTRVLAICNGRFFGSGMHAAPMAQPDDGVFEIIDLGSAPRLKFMLSSSKIYDGSHMKSPDVRHFRCDHIEVKLINEAVSDKFLLDVDGEPLGKLPITVDLIPNAIEVLAPSAVT
jgi:YegS/Rv2252/BmrU family lipid kinase